MFTGIVQSQAKVSSINTENNLCRLVLDVETSMLNQLETGASIAINGVCLTVVQFSNCADNDVKNSQENIAFDVMEETLRVTNLADLHVGSMVNLERSLKFGDELGGHIVSGHVHHQAELTGREQTPTNCCLTFTCQPSWMKYILAKGFISINGISLTVGEVGEDFFNVYLIPETLARTNLGTLSVEQMVNLEFDQQTMTIVTTIERMKL